MNYLKLYTNLMENRRKYTSFSTNLDFYYENHHIIPRCIGGTDKPNNLVLLTTREHYIAHLLLTKIYSHNISLKHAFCMMNMNKSKRRLTARQYETAKNILMGIQRAPFTEETKKKMSEWQRGRTLPEETKKKISETLKAMPEERKLRMSESARKRAPHSEETKRKIADSAKLRYQSEQGNIIKERIRRSNTERTVSEKTKKKISESLKEHFKQS